jgi:aminopeptidase N
VTRQCFDRYHELFGVRYPFGKYDQVFVPEFNAGAMENPGCVTFRDDMVFRSAVTEADREVRTVVVAHEMAHMWFGDLVTMRWWDDLWLNESFAEYLGCRVTAEATRYRDVWSLFAGDRKIWGYAADQRPSTHPVAPTGVPDTDSALLNFDGISYAKGASALRQLVAWLGDEAFLAGLRRYFAAHAYGNASLDDLLAALAAESGRDVGAWARVWLREPQVNTLRPVVTVADDGRYATVSVHQSAPAAYPVLRPHRVALGLYDRDSAGRLVRHERVEVDLDPTVDSGQTPVPELVGVPAAALLLVNDDDLTYAKIRLPEPVLADLPALLPAVADPLARALLWSAAWDATHDAEWPPGRFVELAAAALPAETGLGVFAEMLHMATAVVVRRYLPEAERAAASATLAAACLGVLEAADPGSGRQLAAARGLVGCAGPAEVGLLRRWLAGQRAPEGLPVDAELRWLVLHRLVVLGAAGTADIDAEAGRDRSAQGAEHAARCRAAVADTVGKAEAWHAIVDGDGMSNRLLLATAGGFWQPEQAALTESYVDRYFVEMPGVAGRHTPQVFNRLAEMAYPRYAVAPETTAAAERMLRRPDLVPGLRRAVLDATDDLRRALAARALAGG